MTLDSILGKAYHSDITAEDDFNTLSSDPDFIIAANAKLQSIKNIPDGRCAITASYKKFLTKMLESK